MSTTLDIDNNVKLWIHAFDAAVKGKKPVCPRCNSMNTEVTKDSNDEGIGFLLVTCKDCGKSGYMSRMIFKE